MKNTKRLCVVETNTLDENITVYHCDGPEEALRIFETIRRTYLKDQHLETKKEIAQAADDGIISCDTADGFSMHCSDYGDYEITVKIQKMHSIKEIRNENQD